ncbi:MAG TPA: hypothetical protein VHB21_17050 [Minicystis sp.]|nr:hypothetical protein [Minicystis sp.]
MGNRRFRSRVVLFAALAASSLLAASASAQDRDGVRLRAGFSLDAGGMFGDAYSGFMAGGDARLGVQINHILGLYVDPHLAFGPVSVSGGGAKLNSLIGVFAATGMVEGTLGHRVFLGAGGGFGVVNNPTGPVLHVRGGFYPVVWRGLNGYRRKAFFVAVDSRTYFLSGAKEEEFLGSIGYEAF